MNKRPSHSISALLAGACAVLLAGWFLGPLFIGPRALLFRDVAHYYYPLFQWSQQQWQAGRLPLWNPQDNLGMPLHADATASLFYPGKLLFALPVPFVVALNLYLLAHLWLAAAGSYRAARNWGVSGFGASLAAISYAFGGSVLIQCCNVVFLVSAAWLPWAFIAARKMILQRKKLAALQLGVVLALMTLGGDPQTAYHAGLFAVLGCFLNLKGNWFPFRKAQPAQQSPVQTPVYQSAAAYFALLALAASTAFALAAIQILPSLQWSKESTRAEYAQPRTLLECCSYFMQTNREPETDRWENIQAGLFGKPAAGTHAEHIYEFSVGPWHLPELLWPNVSGRIYPTHRRWIAALPAEGRVWSPSYYLGLAPALFSLFAFRWRSRNPSWRWIRWSTLLAALAALGWYGIGWVIHEMVFAAGGNPEEVFLASPVGGLYWLMVICLPGYVYFRYPAKLLVVAALGMSLLAGRGFDRAAAFSRVRRRFIQFLYVYGFLSLLCLALLLLLLPYFFKLPVQPDDYFGPFDATGAYSDLYITLWHAVILAALLVLLVYFAPQRWLGPGLLLLTTLDLAVAQRGLLTSAPAENWRTPTQLALQKSGDDDSLIRCYRAVSRPEVWREKSDSQRQIEGLAWDRQTLFPKHHLTTRWGLINSYSSVDLQAYAPFLETAQEQAEVRNLLGAQVILSGEGKTSEPQMTMNENALPRAWLADFVVNFTPEDSKRRNPQELPARILELASAQPGRGAVVEAAADDWKRIQQELENSISWNSPVDSCRITLQTPNRVELETELASPRLLVLNDLFANDWHAELATKANEPLQIWKTNGLVRGVVVPAGRQRVIFEYRPRSFYLGGAVSLIAWVFVAGLWLRRYFKACWLNS